MLGLRWGRAANVVARTACLRPREKMGEGQRHSLVHPWTSAAVTALAGGGKAALASLGSRRGWAADTVACATRLQPRAKVGEGQWCSRVHPWMSAAVTAPAGGGSGACFVLLASGSGYQRIGLPCALAAQGGGKGGTAALASSNPGIAAL